MHQYSQYDFSQLVQTLVTSQLQAMPQALWCRHCCGLPHWEIAHASNNAEVTGVQQCTRTFTSNPNISSQSCLITVAIVPAVIYTEKCILSDTIWNRMRPPSAHAESTHKGVNKCLKDITQTPKRPESPTVYPWWSLCFYSHARWEFL